MVPFAATTTCILLLPAAVYFLIWKPWLGRMGRNCPPVTGTIFDLLLNLHRLLDFTTDLARRHKTFMMVTPTWSYIFTVDPANIEHILKTNFSNYGKGELHHHVLKDVLGDGIFTVDGEKWRHQRKIASHQFSTKVLRDYSSAVFKCKAAKLTEMVLMAARRNQTVEIQDLLMKTTMDSIFKVGFGVDLDTLSGSNKKAMIFAKAFDDSSSQLTRRYLDVFWEMKKFLNIGLEAKLKRDIKVLDDFVYEVIDDKIEQMSKQHDDSTNMEDILSTFLVQREKDPENMRYRYLRDIILNFMIAGRDTTAGTLSWFVYMLCKHPAMQEKVAKEVVEATHTNSRIPVMEFASSLTDEALSRMQYLHAALSETLRLYPAVPLDGKVCFSDDTLPDGFRVKKGDEIEYLSFAMGRMKFLWGEDAEAFRPERWLNGDGVFEPESPFKFTAFQAGPRICLGKEFAYRHASAPASAPASASPAAAAPALSDLDRIRRVGSGAGGTVYMVRHRPSGRTYALKVIYGNHDDAVRLQICREIEILRTADNPFVVRCHAMYDHAGEIQILLEYMDGGSLENRHITSEPFLAHVARQVLRGLAYLHSRKIVHRDIKPSNLLINKEHQVKIADFGVGRILAQTMDPCNSSVGTVSYMSPERINTDLNDGAYDGYAGDIWSFGVSMLEFYLGKFPFGENLRGQGDWASLMCAICFSNPPQAPSTASREFQSFIACCLQKEPSKRLTAPQLLLHPFIAQAPNQQLHPSGSVSV